MRRAVYFSTFSRRRKTDSGGRKTPFMGMAIPKKRHFSTPEAAFAQAGAWVEK